MKISDLDNYTTIKGNHDSLFTIIIHNTDRQSFTSELKTRLKKCQNITNKFKKKLINDRIYSLICYIEELKSINTLNCVILVNSDIHLFHLTKKQISTLNDYSIKKINFIYDTVFHIDFIIDLFTNLDFNDVINVDKYTAKHTIFNKNKKKELTTFNLQKDQSKATEQLSEYILKQIKEKCILYGISPILKSISNKKIIEIINGNSSLEDLSPIFDKYYQEKSKLRIKEHSNKIILVDIDGVLAKWPERYIQFVNEREDTNFDNLIDKSYINFEIIPITSYEKGDSGDILMTNYGGIIAIAYY